MMTSVVWSTGAAKTLRSAFGGGGSLRCEHLEVELLIELRKLALCGDGEQFRGHVGQSAIVAHGMVGERADELVGHEGGLAGGAAQRIVRISGHYVSSETVEVGPMTVDQGRRPAGAVRPVGVQRPAGSPVTRKC